MKQVVSLGKHIDSNVYFILAERMEGHVYCFCFELLIE